MLFHCSLSNAKAKFPDESMRERRKGRYRGVGREEKGKRTERKTKDAEIMKNNLKLVDNMSM